MKTSGFDIYMLATWVGEWRSLEVEVDFSIRLLPNRDLIHAFRHQRV